jgi:hypothetical protein
MAYIYLHRRNDTGEVFYVGKGTGNRATTKKGRNPHWHNIVNKAGHSVEIIAKGLTDAEAFWAEPLLIEAHGGVENLTNMSDGGEGWSSEEAGAQSRRNWQDPAVREKMSKAMKEMWQDPAVRERKSKAVKEAMKDPAVREKVSKARKEMWQDPAYREKVSKARKEMWQDPTIREKISKANKRKVECDKCGRMIGVTRLPQHQRGPRCYNSGMIKLTPQQLHVKG